MRLRPRPRPRGPEQAIEEARKLIGRGDVRGAIARLTEANRQEASHEVESELVRVRLEGFAVVREQARPRAWPPTLPDPFPELRGAVPEVASDGLTAELLGGAIRHHGCLLVRGLVPPPGVRQLASDMASAFDARAAWEAGDSPDGASHHWYERLEGHPELAEKKRATHSLSGALWLAETPRTLFHLVELYAESGVLAAIEGYLGEPLALSVNKTVLRSTERRSATGVPTWHQDGAFMGTSVRTVDVWLAMSHCGGATTSPGMEVIPGRVEAIIPGRVDERTVVGKGAGAKFGRTREQVVAAVGDLPILTPEFHPGDALLFDEMFVHRTGITPTTTGDRDAIEAWFFAPSSVPANYVPMVV